MRTRFTRGGLLPAALAMVVAFAVRDARAQQTHAVTIRMDNDAFNFWRTPGFRPDEEYTSGAFLRYDGGNAPWWFRKLGRSYADCVDGARSCRTRSLEVGQHLYSPRRTWDHEVAPAGSRSNAAWLFVEESARLLRAQRADEFSVALGVTGRPALGELSQRIVHAVVPASHRPTDWSDQLAFEPGVILGYTHSVRYALNHAMDVIPVIGAELGNVATNAHAGVRIRIGTNMWHPWLPEAPSRKIGFAFTAGASAKAVARDLFLDGSSYTKSPSVGHESLTHSFEWALQFKWRDYSVSWGAVRDGRTYATGPAAHTWSTLTATVSWK